MSLEPRYISQEKMILYILPGVMSAFIDRLTDQIMGLNKQVATLEKKMNCRAAFAIAVKEKKSAY